MTMMMIQSGSKGMPRAICFRIAPMHLHMTPSKDNAAGQLLKALRPLFDILERMRNMLLGMYSTYEKDFGGSSMLKVVLPFVKFLQDLVAAAEIEIEPLHVPATVDRSDMLIHVLSEEPEEGGKHPNRRGRRLGGSTGTDYPDAKRRIKEDDPIGGYPAQH